LVSPEADFHAYTAAVTPHRYVTPIIVWTNVAVYVAMMIWGQYGRCGSLESLLAYGAVYSPRIAEGEGWRLLTGMFLHAGVVHLAVNMVVFWKVGMLVERIVGNVAFALLYLASGLTAGVASIHANPGMLGVGASGAIFGVYGGLLGLLTRYHVYIRFGSILKFTLFVLFLLADGFYENHTRQFPRVDMAAHVGGFVSGFLMGAVLAQPLARSVKPDRRHRQAGIAGAGAVIVLAGLISVPRVEDIVTEFISFERAESRLISRYNRALRQLLARQTTESQFLQVIEQQILPEWQKAAERLEALKDLSPRSSQLVQELTTYASLRRQSWELLAEAIRHNDPAKAKQSEEISRAAESIGQHALKDGAWP
jgi:rhomboid protease GluP